MAQIKLNAQTNSATDPGLSGLFKSSVTSIYIVLFLSQTVTCSLWGYIDSVSFSHCTSTTIVLHLNSLISFWYHDVTSTEVFRGCLENSELMPRQGHQLTHGWAAQQAQLPFPSPAFSLDWSQNGFLYPWSPVPPATAESICVWEIWLLGKVMVQVSSSWDRTQAGQVLMSLLLHGWNQWRICCCVLSWSKLPVFCRESWMQPLDVVKCGCLCPPTWLFWSQEQPDMSEQMPWALWETHRVPAVPCVPWIPQQHRALPAVNVNIPVAIPVHLSALSISQTAHKWCPATWKFVLDLPLPVQPEPLGKEGSKFPLSMAWLQGQDTALWLYPTPSAPTILFMAAAEPVL